MFTERNIWLAATMTAVGILLLLMLQPPPERRDGGTPRFDDNVLYAIYGCTSAPISGQKQLFAFTDGRGVWHVTLP